MVTIFADQVIVQCPGQGETLALPVDLRLEPVGKPEAHPIRIAIPGREGSHSAQLFSDLFSGEGAAGDLLFAHGEANKSRLTEALSLDAQRGPRLHQRRPGTPASLVTEVLPEITDEFEEKLAAHIEFSPKVLDDRLRVKSRLVERTTDVFSATAPEDRDIWARMSPMLIADQAQQIAFEFEDVDRRSFHRLLKERFRQALEGTGHDLPGTEEELAQQLDIILVRNPTLVRDAYRRVRSEHVTAKEVALPTAISTEVVLEPAAKNIYGVYPESLSDFERELAEILDTSEGIEWWHRNPARKPYSVGLYRWNEGIGFFPDFVVGVVGRSEGDGIALSELKGPQLLVHDRLKAGAVHIRYGRVYMIGRESDGGPFRLWRLLGKSLVDDGVFEIQRLKYS